MSINKATEHNNKGVQCFKQGDFEQAIQEYDKAISYDDTHPAYYKNKGIILQRLGRYEQAIECHEGELARATTSKDRWKAHYEKGVSLAYLCRYDQAIESFDKALAQSTTKEEKSDAYVRKGVTLLEAFSNYDDVIEQGFDKAIRVKKGEHKGACLWKGIALLQRGDKQHALECFEKAVDKGLTGYPELYTYEGNTLYQLGRYDEAFKQFDIAIEKRGNVPEHHWTHSINNAIQRQPDHFMSPYVGKAIIEEHQHENVQGALELYDEGIRMIVPFAYQCYYFKGISFETQGRYKDAAHCFNKVLEMDTKGIYKKSSSSKKTTCDKKQRNQDQPKVTGSGETVLNNDDYSSDSSEESPRGGKDYISRPCMRQRQNVKALDKSDSQASGMSASVDGTSQPVSHCGKHNLIMKPKLVNKLYGAAQRRNFETLKVAKRFLDAVDAGGNTVLHELLQSERKEERDILREMVLHDDLEFDLDVPDSNGKTVLHHAVEGIHVELAVTLVSLGTDPDVIDASQRTVLSYIAESGNFQLYRQLYLPYQNCFNHTLEANIHALEVFKIQAVAMGNDEADILTQCDSYVDQQSLPTHASTNVPSEIDPQKLYEQREYTHALEQLKNSDKALTPSSLLMKSQCYYQLELFREANSVVEYLQSLHHNESGEMNEQLLNESMVLHACCKYRLCEFDGAEQCFQELFKFKQYQKLMVKSEKIVQVEYPKFLYYRGNSFTSVKGAVTSINPDEMDVELLNILGDIERSERNWHSAALYFNKALQLPGWESHPLTLSNKGMLMFDLGQSKEAKQYMNDALQILETGYSGTTLSHLSIQSLHKTIESSLEKLSLDVTVIDTVSSGGIHVDNDQVDLAERKSYKELLHRVYRLESKVDELKYNVDQKFDVMMVKVKRKLGRKASKESVFQEINALYREKCSTHDVEQLSHMLWEELSHEANRSEVNAGISSLVSQELNREEIKSIQAQLQLELATKANCNETQKEISQKISDKLSDRDMEHFQKEFESETGEKLSREQVKTEIEEAVHNKLKELNVLGEELKQRMIQLQHDKVDRGEVSYAINKNEEWAKVASELESIMQDDSLVSYYYTFINVFESHLIAAQAVASKIVVVNQSKVSCLKDFIPIPVVKEVMSWVLRGLDRIANMMRGKRLSELVQLLNKTDRIDLTRILARRVTVVKAEKINHEKDTIDLDGLFSRLKRITAPHGLESNCRTSVEKLAYKDASKLLGFCFVGMIDFNHNIIDQLERLVMEGEDNLPSLFSTLPTSDGYDAIDSSRLCTLM